MMFMNSEARSRAQYVDDVVMETIDNLERTDVAERLGSGVTEGFLELLNWAVIPNQRNNTLSLPKQYEDSDVLPVMAFERDNKGLYLDRSLIRQTELQQKKVAEKLLKLGASSDDLPERVASAISDHFLITKERMPIIRDEPIDRIGLTASSTLSIPLGHDNFTDLGYGKFSDKRIFRGMPIIGISASASDQEAATVVLVHELQHAVQHLMEPVEAHGEDNERFNKDGFKRELEAYYIGREYSDTLFESDIPQYAGRYALLNFNSVDDIRHANADYPGSLDPTDKVYDALMAADINVCG